MIATQEHREHKYLFRTPVAMFICARCDLGLFRGNFFHNALSAGVDWIGRKSQWRLVFVSMT
jgi:hypothetical protein